MRNRTSISHLLAVAGILLVPGCGLVLGLGDFTEGGGGGTGTSATTTGGMGGSGGGVIDPCKDSKLGKGETDVDCGGTCDPCPDGKKCGVNQDCAGKTCIDGLCVAPSCKDKATDGKETDVDCGGDCAACADDKTCGEAKDCQSGVCTGLTCVAASCTDTVKNGAETGVDCGGGCPACAPGQPCVDGKDCQSGLCAASECKDNLVWAKAFGDDLAQSIEGVATDVLGGVVLTGRFVGTIDFGGGVLTAAGTGTTTDTVLARLDGSGAYVYGKRSGDENDEGGTAVATDGSTAYFTGSAAGTVDFGGGPLAGLDVYYPDVYVAGLDATGKEAYQTRFKSDNIQNGTAIAVNAAHEVLVGVNWVAGADLGCGAVSDPSNTYRLLVGKQDAAHGCAWSKVFAGTGQQTLTSLSYDAAGDVLLGGFFIGDIDFGGGAVQSAFGASGFVAKLDPAGAYLSATALGTSGSSVIVQAVAADATGNVYVAGRFDGPSLKLGSFTLANAGVGTDDIFVAKMDSTGAFLWAKRFGDALYQSPSRLVLRVDAAGHIVLGGDFVNTVNFGGGLLTSAGNADLFVVELDGAGNHLWSRGFGDAAPQRFGDMALAAPGALVVVGAFQGTLDFGGTKLTSKGNDDGFVVKLKIP